MPPSTLQTLDAYIAHYAASQPDQEAAVFGNLRLTYRMLEQRIATLAAKLAADGLQPGDRVGVLSTPRPEYLILLNAILRAGGIYVGLNPRHTAPEMAHAIGLTAPRRVFVLQGEAGAALVGTLREAVGSLQASPIITPFASVDDLPSGQDVGISTSTRHRDDPAVIVFTSGTTGRPKGATLHHSGLMNAAISQWEHLLVERDHRMLSNLPINHVGCILNLTFGSLVGGGTLVFQEKFDPAETLRLIEAERISVWLQVPAMFQMATSHPDFATRTLSSLQAICAGGGALPAQTLARLRKTGARIYVEYGQTELMSTCAFSDHGTSDADLATTVGRFDPRFNIRIADPSNLVCATGEVGEIQATGDCVMKGYWNDEGATKAAFTTDGWLKTGDLAALRPDGLVELRGRLNEMIKSGGYNLYPREIEFALEAHPAIEAVVVVGLNDPTFGESAHAVLSLKPGMTVSHQEAKTWCAGSLANYKTPRSFRRLDDLPRLPNGKIDRRSVKAMAPSLPIIS